MSNPISATTRAQFGASIVALAPAVMLVGLFAHPYIATLPDEAALKPRPHWLRPAGRSSRNGTSGYPSYP